MAVIEINPDPSRTELRWFGLLVLAFFGLIGGLLFWNLSTPVPSAILWSVGICIALPYYLIRPLRRPIYVAWMYLFMPIGWVVSHLVLGGIYYLLITPIGVTMRLFGRDRLTRKFDGAAESYWAERVAVEDTARYFRQS